jgi:transposase, IS5 family
MRCKWDAQLSVFHSFGRSDVAMELAAMSRELDGTPEILELAYKDLVGLKREDTGRFGMTAEQVLCCAVLKQFRNLSYEELAFHLEDSQAFRAFGRLRVNQCPGASTLQENISALRASTWEAINAMITNRAESEGLEKGRKVRLDSTAVESDIHHPTDSRLLGDGIWLVTRLLVEGTSLRPVPVYRFSDHRRAAKKKVLAILNARGEKVRRQIYQDLLGIAARVVGYGLEAIEVLASYDSEDIEQLLHARVLGEKLERALGIFRRVIDQTQRRVIRGQKVPASEKVVSFYECHTDIIEKGGRDTYYGHKVFLMGGASGLIVGCKVVRGNPSDSGKFMEMIYRHKKLYGRVPRQVAADAGFASQDNLRKAKLEGVKDVMFSKRRGLSVLDMVKSNWVYKRLRNFRAGIEANISRLKRAFGLDRCDWKGWEGFLQYVWSAVVSYNLSVLARKRMAIA